MADSQLQQYIPVLILALVAVAFAFGTLVASSLLGKIGKQPVQLGVGARYYADKPNGGPDWGLRFTMTFLFPK